MTITDEPLPDVRTERKVPGASRPLKVLIIVLLISATGMTIATALLEQYAATTVFGEDDPGSALIGLAFLLIALVGGLAVMGQPRNATGWVLLAAGLLIELSGFGTALGATLPISAASRVTAEFVAGFGWYGGLLLLINIFPFIFPNGRPPAGRFWATVYLVACLYVGGLLLTYVVAGVVLLLLPSETVPEALAAFVTLYDGLFLGALPVLLLGVVSLVVRYRQANDTAKQQMKWLMLTLGLPLAAFSLLAGLDDWTDLALSNEVWGALYLIIPAGLGIALLRYNLFDVDTVIRKTAQYAIVTGLLALLYFGIVVLLQRWFSDVSGQTSPIAVVLSTLLIAAMFNPIRKRVQDFIDRRFYRRKYDAEKILNQFAATVRDEPDLDQLATELLRVIQETMQPEHVSLWLRPVRTTQSFADGPATMSPPPEEEIR
jgi:MFS family permease